MTEFETKALAGINRLLQVSGGDCEQAIPIPESDANGVGARTFMQRTQFDGALGVVGPANVATAPQISAPAFVLQFAKCLDAAGNEINAAIRVYFDRPSLLNREKYALVRPGQWLKRRRGWQEGIWITADQDLFAIFPVVKVSADPSFEIHPCGCATGGAAVVPGALFTAVDQTAGTYPAYAAAIYDTGDPAGGAALVTPGSVGYLHARATIAQGGTIIGDGVLLEVRHMIGTLIIGVEELGLVPPVAPNVQGAAGAADADGSDRRTVLSGMPLVMRGNRVQIVATGTAAGLKYDITVRWGDSGSWRVTEVGGAFSYDATAGNIAASTRWARFGVIRPMKSCSLLAVMDLGFTGTAFSMNYQLCQVNRSAGTQTAVGATAAVGLLQATIANVVPIAGLGADAAIDQNVSIDGVALYNLNQLAQAEPAVGRVLWRATMVHV